MSNRPNFPNLLREAHDFVGALLREQGHVAHDAPAGDAQSGAPAPAAAEPAAPECLRSALSAEDVLSRAEQRLCEAEQALTAAFTAVDDHGLVIGQLEQRLAVSKYDRRLWLMHSRELEDAHIERARLTALFNDAQAAFGAAIAHAQGTRRAMQMHAKRPGLRRVDDTDTDTNTHKSDP